MATKHHHEPVASIAAPDDELVYPDKPYSAENPIKRAVIAEAEDPPTEHWRSTTPDLEAKVGKGALPSMATEEDELLYPDRPYSASNPIKRAVATYKGEDEREDHVVDKDEE